MRAALENAEIFKTLREFDHWLLLNRPRLWAIRLPYLLAYALAGNLGAYLFIQALPLQLHHVGNLLPILWVVFFVGLGAFIFWLTRFNRHSAAKAFENTSAFKGLVDFIIYLVCILALLSPSITASFALTGRFDGMISLAEVREDMRTKDGYDRDDTLPQDLVEKYTGLDAEARTGMRNQDINRIVRYNLRRLEEIKENDFEDLWFFFIPHLIVSHFGLVMFAAKHVKRSTVYRTMAYGVGLFILFMIFIIFIDLLRALTFIGRLIYRWDLEDNLWPRGYLILVGIMTLIAGSVFRLKRYREFVAMNIAILPVAAYFFLPFRAMEFIYDHDVFKDLRDIEEFQIGLLIFSPLIYIWLIPLLKAMYIRLLSLPREG